MRKRPRKLQEENVTESACIRLLRWHVYKFKSERQAGIDNMKKPLCPGSMIAEALKGVGKEGCGKNINPQSKVTDVEKERHPHNWLRSSSALNELQ